MDMELIRKIGDYDLEEAREVYESIFGPPDGRLDFAPEEESSAASSLPAAA